MPPTPAIPDPIGPLPGRIARRLSEAIRLLTPDDGLAAFVAGQLSQAERKLKPPLWAAYYAEDMLELKAVLGREREARERAEMELARLADEDGDGDDDAGEDRLP